MICRFHYLVKTFDGGLYGLSIFFSIQLHRLHFPWGFLKEQMSALFLNVLWLAFSSLSADFSFNVAVERVSATCMYLPGT